MILRPRLEEIKTIGYYLGRIIVCLGLTFLMPVALGLALKEISPTLDFVVGGAVTLISGLALVF